MRSVSREKKGGLQIKEGRSGGAKGEGGGGAPGGGGGKEDGLARVSRKRGGGGVSTGLPRRKPLITKRRKREG